MIEDIINLPSQLNLAALAELHVLEDRDVIVKGRWLADKVSREVADVTLGQRFAEARRIDREFQTGDVGSAYLFVRIAKQDRTRGSITSSEIADTQPLAGGCGACL